MNKNRVIAFILVFCLVCPMSFPIASAQEVEITNDCDLLCAIGVVDDELVAGEDFITRGDMAYYAEKLLNEQDDNIKYSGAFSDVTKEDKFAAAIERLTTMGVLTGYGAQKYYPTKPAEISEAIKILVEICGYRYMANVKGGYPGGYAYTAKRLGLLNGIESTEGILEKDTFVKLLYNALDVPVAINDRIIINEEGTSQGYVIDEDRTVLREYFDMYRAYGIVQAIEYINYSETSLGEDEVLIDGCRMKKNSDKIDDYLGYSVEYIYRNVDGEQPKLVYFKPENCKVIELSGSNVLSVSGMNLTYEAEAKNRTVSVDSAADIIYNFKKVNYDEKYLENLSYAKIKLIDNKNIGGGINFIIVETLENFVVNTMSKSSETVTEKGDLTKKLNLDANDYDTLILLNKKGETVSFDEIVEDTVITYAKDADKLENAKILKCYIANDSRVGKLEVKRTSDSADEYVIDGMKFKAIPGFAEKSGTIGTEVKALFNVLGDIVYIDSDTSGGFKTAFLIDTARLSGLSPSYQVKLYTKDDNDEKVFDFADKVNMNGISTKENNLIVDSLTPGVVFYKLNANGEVSALEIPVTKDDYNDGRFCISYPKNDDSYCYKSNSTFAGKVVFNEDTALFRVGTVDGNVDVEAIEIMTGTDLIERKFYTVEGYTAAKDSMSAAAIVIYDNASKKIGIDYNMLSVAEVVQILNDEGELCTKIIGNVYGENREFEVSDDYKTTFDAFEIQSGDVIRYALDSKKRIQLIEKFYDAESGWCVSNPYPDSAKVYAETYIVFAKTIGVDEKHIRYLPANEYAAYSGWVSDCYAFPKSRFSQISVIDFTNKTPHVYSGDTSEVEPGDLFIYYTSLQAPYGLVLIKGLDDNE